MLADQGSLQQPVLWAILLRTRTVLSPDTALVGMDRDGECEVLCPVAELIGQMSELHRGSQLASEDGEGQRKTGSFKAPSKFVAGSRSEPRSLNPQAGLGLGPSSPQM